jgi:hypothetical protein
MENPVRVRELFRMQQTLNERIGVSTRGLALADSKLL